MPSRAFPCQPVHRAEKISSLFTGERNAKSSWVQSLVGASPVDKGSEVVADRFWRLDRFILAQELRQAEYIVAMLPDVLTVDVPICFGTSSKVKKGASLKWYEKSLVDDSDAVDLPFCCLEHLEIGIVQQDCRKADDIMVYRNPRVDCVFGQIEVHGSSRKQLDHEGEAAVSRLVKSVKLPSPVASFACLISARIEKGLESPSKFGVDHLDTKHHVDILCCPEIETRSVEQQIESGTSEDRILTLMRRKVIAELVDSGYHGIPFNTWSAAMEMRSSPWSWN